MIDALRPPDLDERGLAGAIRRLAIECETHGDLDRLPAAVEVAAYRITLEAMTNVARHAGAQRARVRIDIGDAVDIEVTDDGAGLPAALRPGVGISSMRERALELGGICTIERAAPRGTVVRASIPLELA